MNPFTDCKGREWTVDLTASLVRKVREATQSNLRKMAKDQIDGGGELAELVFYDPIQVMEILWVIVEEQAKARSITFEMFEDGFDAKTNQSAAIALFGAIQDFFRPENVAKAVKERVPKMMENMGKLVHKGLGEKEMALDTAPSIISSPNGSAPAGSEPALPASAPAPTRSES